LADFAAASLPECRIFGLADFAAASLRKWHLFDLADFTAASWRKWHIFDLADFAAASLPDCEEVFMEAPLTTTLSAVPLAVELPPSTAPPRNAP